MIRVIFRGAFVLWLCLIAASPAWSQKAATNRNVNLRRDPSTSSPVLEHLAAGDRLMLVDPAADSGFYHVRTEDEQVGWVLAKYVTVFPPAQPVASPRTAGTATECDPQIAAHVYRPQRLLVRQDCVAVTGTIMDATADQSSRRSDGVRHEPDGDSHGWLKVDQGFENLLNAGNISDEGGNLVFEIICRFPVSQADAMAACQGYTDKVNLPPVGSRVRIVGRFVQDSFHAQWNEIHPVTSITILP